MSTPSASAIRAMLSIDTFRSPPSLAPRGLSRVQSAGYVGVSATKFDEMVEDGRMPKPIRIDARVLWDRYRLDEAFEALPHEGEINEWDAA